MRLKFLCSRAKRNCSYDPVVMIIGNKVDLKYDRIVGRKEAELLAKTLGCNFMELSVRESAEDVYTAFLNLYSDYKDRKKSGTTVSPKFLGRKRNSQGSAKLDLDSNPPRPRERSTSFIGVPDIWNKNFLFAGSEVMEEDDSDSFGPT